MSRSESVRLVFAIAIVGLLLIACGPRDGGGVELGTWVGTITTEGTVVNESGSVWGGTVRVLAQIDADRRESPRPSRSSDEHAPVAVDPAEREWWRRYAVVSTRLREPSWSWDGAEIPGVKPAFTAFVPTYAGQVWVIREGAGHKVPDCLEELTVDNVREAVDKLCWRSSRIIDVFAAAGLYLGGVEPPDSDLWLVSQGLFVRGRAVLIWVTDEAGVHRVKRYRLVLPGEEGH